MKIDATKLAQAFDAGAFNEAYIEGNLNKPYEKETVSRVPLEYFDAYVLGFFASYETHEIPPTDREEFNDAWVSDVGKAVLAAGYCDSRPEMESE